MDKIRIFAPIAILIFIAVGFAYWFLKPARDVGGMGVPLPKPEISLDDQKKSLKGELQKGEGVGSKIKGSWACFRGPDLDGISKEDFPLSLKWSKTGPPVLWSMKVAKGHAGAVIHEGRVYVLDYDSENLKDVIRCLSLETGKEIWNYAYPIKTKTYHGITRSVPAVNDRYIVTIGPKAQVYCLDSKTGEYKWSKSLVLEYGSTIPKWYSGQCPLLEGDRVVIAPCGPKGFVARFDCETGMADWVSENKMGWEMTHTSVMPMQLKNKKTYVYSGSGGVAAVDAENGKVLWVNRKWKIKIAACASPLVIDQERLFLSAGYSAGSMMIKVVQKEGGGWDTEILFQLKEPHFGAVQHTPILYQNYIYGVRPNGELVCMNLDGKIAWESGTEKFGIGPFMMTKDHMFLLDSKSCKLTLIKVNPTSFEPVVSAELFKGHDAYGLMALAGGLLIVRDLNQMVCMDVTANGYKGLL